MSVQAARTGLTLWHLKGADAYLAYHHAVFASGEHEGRLSQPAIDAALQAAVTNARRREASDTCCLPGAVVMGGADGGEGLRPPGGGVSGGGAGHARYPDATGQKPGGLRGVGAGNGRIHAARRTQQPAPGSG
ncbi:hypothetical protein SGP1_0017 (plasmid) [Sodalis glossinidius str. 'morsitans']|uniref:Uncharacterized protein n=1 Tax=Sodalis glossinidius (strain morsitans) TaxID=343509 RepID=Q2NQ51_SODGM|nr:hypothetical protein SGP1_0017 [Sodalis glossinidius str. 'morsitans']